MKLIDQPREEDNLAEFGSLLRFAALVYDPSQVAEEDCEANAPFAPHNIDGDVAFPPDRASADRAFDAWVETLKSAEEQFIEEGEEEGFVALFETPKGLMILAGTNLMGFPTPDLDASITVFEGMPHVTWARILDDVFKEQTNG